MSKSPDYGLQDPLGENEFGRKISQETIWGRSTENKDDGEMSLWDRKGIAHEDSLCPFFFYSQLFPQDVGEPLAGSMFPVNVCGISNNH